MAAGAMAMAKARVTGMKKAMVMATKRVRARAARGMETVTKRAMARAARAARVIATVTRVAGN